jgi:outer membrane protein
MRHCIMIVGVAVALLGVNFTVVAADVLPQGKIGYVNLQRALNEVGEGKQAKAQLEKVFAKRQKEIATLQQTLESEQRALEKDRLTVSPETLQKKEDAYRQRFLQMTEKMNRYKMELAQKENESTGAILNALQRIVQKMGQEKGYEMILETSQDVVLYSPTKADLTAEVIKRYNTLPKSQRRLPKR